MGIDLAKLYHSGKNIYRLHDSDCANSNSSGVRCIWEWYTYLTDIYCHNTDTSLTLFVPRKFQLATGQHELVRWQVNTPANINESSPLFWDMTLCSWAITDVSGSALASSSRNQVADADTAICAHISGSHRCEIQNSQNHGDKCCTSDGENPVGRGQDAVLLG